MHLTTSNSGGAGVAAVRLAKAQQNDLRTIARVSTPKDASSSRRGILVQKTRSIESKVLTGIQQTIAQKEVRFVSPLSVSQLDWEHIRDFSPDILHIHNWYNFLSLEDIRQLLQRFKVVFTSHDERLLTGGCHITFGCERYLKGCHSCPQVRFASNMIFRSANSLQGILRESNNYSIIAPSNWLVAKFQLSPFINPAAQIKLIPNVIPMGKYSPTARTPRLNIAFLFVTNKANPANKGLPEVQKALEKLSRLNAGIEFQLQIAGIESKSGLGATENYSVKYSGQLSDTELQDLYSNSDALIVASKSENSPNVISEAQLRGAIVIAHAVGGIPELISNQETGLLYDSGKKSLYSTLQEFLEMSESDRENIRSTAFQSAKSRHETNTILDQTYDLYVELLRRNSN